MAVTIEASPDAVRVAEIPKAGQESADPTRSIPTSRGGTAIVDSADYDRLARYKWTLSTHGYAMRGARGTTVLMQREIMGAEVGSGKIVHHINGNRLDNRRSNLLVTTARAHSRIHGRVNEDRGNIGLSAPKTLIARLDSEAAAHGETRAETVRRILGDALS